MFNLSDIVLGRTRERLEDEIMDMKNYIFQLKKETEFRIQSLELELNKLKEEKK